MTDSAKPALIADAEPKRVAILREILLHEFNKKTIEVDNYVSLKAEVENRNKSEISPLLVFVATTLPYSQTDRTPVLPGLIHRLGFGITFICIYSTATAPHGWETASDFSLPISPDGQEGGERDRIIYLLAGGAKLKRARPAPVVRLMNDPILYEQIRALSEDRNLEVGQKYLSYLIRNLSLCDGGGVEIEKLVQGKSGARVFRITPDTIKQKIGRLALKLNTKSDRWKLDLEVERHIEAQRTLGVEWYQAHVAKLREVDGNCIAEYANWCAVCYDFLGDEKLGPFLDLETALIATPEKLQEKVAGIKEFKFNRDVPSQVAWLRETFFNTMLDWLCDTWYRNPDYTQREERLIWQVEDRDPRNYPSMPPYQLAGKNKGHILSFLDSREAEIGSRFFDDWMDRTQIVRRFIELQQLGHGENEFFNRVISVALSPAHGDLNANNILLWLKEGRTFLIDFPCFQNPGHALQDLASLEVALKFALLDRQGHSPKDRLQAFDYTYSQMTVWKEIEDFLLHGDGKAAKKARPRPQYYTENAALCLKLIRHLRQQAKKIQAQDCGAPSIPDFADEYLPALLFHTVRAIGYDSLSIFKRLLAVYSASIILDRLRFKP